MMKPKLYRKQIPLTDTQSKGLSELSEYDGLDPVDHARKAIDEYLKKRNSVISLPSESEIKASFKSASADNAIAQAMWISGDVDKYEFSALVRASPAKSGIDKGRISKLSIWDPKVLKKTNNFTGSCIVNFDRGWDIRPSKIAEPYFNKVKSLIDFSLDQFLAVTDKN